MCECEHGWVGASCAEHACASDCHGRGACINGTCACALGAHGASCEREMASCADGDWRTRATAEVGWADTKLTLKGDGPFAVFSFGSNGVAQLRERCGNPAGIPCVFLHGGPGAGCDERSRRFFDPDAYDIVVFDQRGSGRSSPNAADDLAGSLVENTTPKLVGDIERLREHLGI